MNIREYDDPRCEDCKMCYPIMENFGEDEGRLCCVLFPVLYKEGAVIFTQPDSKCEMFSERG